MSDIGKTQRDPATGKNKRTIGGKRLRNVEEDPTCCCGNDVPPPVDDPDAPFIPPVGGGFGCVDQDVCSDCDFKSASTWVRLRVTGLVPKGDPINPAGMGGRWYKITSFPSGGFTIDLPLDSAALCSYTASPAHGDWSSIITAKSWADEAMTMDEETLDSLAVTVLLDYDTLGPLFSVLIVISGPSDDISPRLMTGESVYGDPTCRNVVTRTSFNTLADAASMTEQPNGDVVVTPCKRL